MEDILLNQETKDYDFVNGDFSIGESTEQHQSLLLSSYKGDWRENPMVGVGIGEFLKDDDEESILPEIKQQFEKDGMKVNSISMDGDNITIDAQYR